MGNTIVVFKNREWIKKARSYATEGVPPPDALPPDPIESDVEAFFQDLYASEARPIVADLSAIADRSNKTRAGLIETGQRITARDPVAHLESLLDADMQAAKPAVIDHIKDRIRAFRHLSVYRAEHGLTKSAEKRKKTGDVVVRISFFLVLETLTNAYFYATGIGLLEGAGLAFFFSLVIALLGFGTGFLWRYKNAPTVAERVGGWLALIVGSAIAIFLSSVTATFRALVARAFIQLKTTSDASTPTDVSTQFVDLFASAVQNGAHIFFLDIPFKEIYATLLFAFAIAAFVNAVIVGYTFIDPIPGYTKASEAFDESNAAFRSAEDKLRADLLRRAEAMRGDRQRLVTDINAAGRIHGEMAIKVDDCVHRLDQLDEKMTNDFRRNVRDYRRENTTHRQPVPPPAYFADDPVIALDTNPRALRNAKDGLSELNERHAALDGFIPDLNAESAELEQYRARLAGTITEALKAWEDQAVNEVGREPYYEGRRTNPVVATTPPQDPTPVS